MNNAFAWSVLLTFFCSVSFAETVAFRTDNNQFEIEFVEVGNPGNPNDAIQDAWHFGTGRFYDELFTFVGGVDYVYSIAKYEASRGMAEIVDAETEWEMFMRDYSLIGVENRPDMPVYTNTVGVFAFVNWLNTSLGYSEAYLPNAGNDWKEEDPGFDPDYPKRNRLAKFFVPSLDEWHKAAYYDPDKNDGEGGYWIYPTGSDEEPPPVLFGTQEGTAVFGDDELNGPADIMEAGGLSSYGVMAMGGNVAEIDENRAERGGDFQAAGVYLQSKWRLFDPASGHAGGIRVIMSAAELSGDFNSDAATDAADIDILASSMRASKYSPAYDFNMNGTIDDYDQSLWVEDIVATHFGDANLDGQVSFSDFLVLAENYSQPSGWAGGDFDGDGQTHFEDFVLLAENYGKGGIAAAVPEPSSEWMLVLGSLLVLRRKRVRHI